MPALAGAKEPLIDTLPHEESIRQRAKELSVKRGNQSGSQLDDWLQAEQKQRKCFLRRANPPLVEHALGVFLPSYITLSFSYRLGRGSAAV